MLMSLLPSLSKQYHARKKENKPRQLRISLFETEEKKKLNCEMNVSSTSFTSPIGEVFWSSGKVDADETCRFALRASCVSVPVCVSYRGEK